MSVAYYAINQKECKERYELTNWIVEDSTKMVFNFWHQLDDPGLKDIYPLTLPSIKINKLIYLPMLTE